MNIWDDLVIFIRGKRIGILGPRAAGKTTLHSWLRDRELPEEYRPTYAPAEKARARPKIQSGSDERRISIKKGRDIGGEMIPYLGAWQRVIAESDVLLYLFDVLGPLENNDDYRREMVRDCGMIGALIAEKRSAGSLPRLALVGTHCDLVEGYCPPSDAAGFLSFIRRIRELEPVKDSLWGLREPLDNAVEPELVLGSLVDEESARELEYRLLVQHLEL